MGAITTTIKNIQEKVTLSFDDNVIAVDVIKELNKIPRAEILLLNNSVEGYPLFDDGFFDPGQEIEIILRHENDPASESTLFKGPVTKQSIRSGIQGPLLCVYLKDSSNVLTKGRYSKVYKDLTDSKLITQVIKDGGASVGTVDVTTVTHVEMTQYNCSYWDFLVIRAEANSLLVSVDEGKVSAKKIVLDAKVTTIDSEDIRAFEFEADSESQYGNIKSQNWEIAEQNLASALEGKEFKLGQKGLLPTAVAKDLKNTGLEQVSSTPMEEKELQSWSDARSARNRLAFIRGSLTIKGDGKLKVFDTVEISGMSKLFNGKALVSGVRHRVDTENSWLTDIQLGLSDVKHAAKYTVSDVPAAGLLPAINGLHIGLIMAFEEDPEKEFRVKVQLPGVGKKGDALWARLASPDAGKERGYFFQPEVGDEVVIGFFNGDPRQAVVLGSLYSSSNPPLNDWSKLSQDNNFKGIVSRSGTRIEFVDKKDKAKLIIETKSKNKITLDDGEKAVEIADQNGNIITMNKDGIKISSKGKVEIEGSKIEHK